MSTNEGISKSERDELGRVVRKTGAVLRRRAKERTTALAADFEEHISAIYTPDDDAAMRALYAEASAACQAADAALAHRCRELGIPETFRPSIAAGWYGRGENALAARRGELRKVHQAAAAAYERRALAEIEEWELDRETILAAGQLQSDDAKAFLAKLPAVEELMPPLSVRDVERLAAAQGVRSTEDRARLRLGALGPTMGELRNAALAGGVESEAGR